MMQITKREGLMLYWCEGSKDKFAIYVNNTNPKILQLFIQWMEKYYGVKRKEFTIFLNLWSSKKNQEIQIKKEWAKILKVKLSQFRKTWFKPTKPTKVGDKYHLGTCRVRINRKKIADKIKEDIKQEFG